MDFLVKETRSQSSKTFLYHTKANDRDPNFRASQINDLKLIEKQIDNSEENGLNSTVKIARPIPKRAQRTYSNSEGNSNPMRTPSNHSKSKPIDIEQKHHSSGETSSYKNNTPNKREKNKGKWTKGWKDEECFGSPLDHNISKDFDFEKNLALFNKQALWDELNAQKPDVVRQVDNKKTAKYR